MSIDSSLFLTRFKKIFPFFLLVILSYWQADELLREPWIETSDVWLAFLSNTVFYLLLAFWNPILLRIALVVSFLLSIIIFPTLQVYGFIDEDFLASILYTNLQEGLSYLNVLTTEIVLKLILLTLVVFFLMIAKYERPKGNKWVLLVLTTYLVVLPIYKYYNSTDKIKYVVQKVWYTHISPIKYGTYLTQTYFELKAEKDKIIQMALQPDDWKIIHPESIKKTQNIVIVIGESLRRDFMHQYGFPVQNTPFIDQSPHITFRNFISAGTHTVESLHRMLAFSDDIQHPAPNNSLVKLLKKAGFRTYWASNQGFIGKHDSAISIFSESCDESYNLFGGSYNGHKEDTDLLPGFNAILQKDQHPKVIFLHTIGSHPDACGITHEKYDEYILSDQISCYSKTVKMTDNFLRKVYSQLQKTQGSFLMVYFSDHGTVVNKDLNVVHGSKTKQAYDVPLLIWKNNLTTSKTYQALRNGKDFIYLISELIHLQTKNIHRNYRFLSEDIDSTASMVINSDRMIADYYQLKDNFIPKF